MNSPTHSFLALALLSKSGDTKRNWAVFIGALIPDAAVYVWFIWQIFIKGENQRRIWRELYFEPPMQLFIAPFNSIPLFAAIALLGWWQRGRLFGKALLFFALAALIHIATDFPVHNHDAYRHFWPFSDWRFISPLSYYEAAHHAHWVAPIEMLIALWAIYILRKRFSVRWGHIVLNIFACLYVLGFILALLNLILAVGHAFS